MTRREPSHAPDRPGRRWIPQPRWAALSWAVLTVALLVLPAPEGVRDVGWLRALAGAGVGADKAFHALLFGVQAVLVWRWVRTSTWPAAAAVAFLGTVLFGAATELLQLGLPGRSAELGDLIADGVGALVALAGAAWIAPGTDGRTRWTDW